METIKNIYAHLDLYGTDVLMAALQTNFSHVSFTRTGETLPKAGSQCKQTKGMLDKFDFTIEKCLFHRNGNVSIKTIKPVSNGKKAINYFTFLNL